jgi:hypothetical protein
MNRRITLGIRSSAPLVTLAALAFGAVRLEAQQDKIASAMSAAPETIARHATIMDWPATAGGEPRELRAGNNGWVCFPSTPTAVSASAEDPMCLDKEFQGWARAWASHQRPQVRSIGVAYLLRGDMGASNTDPFAKEATATNHWIRTGPHVMIIEPDTRQLDALPTDPNNGGPWVMWKGTPYAHIMVPLGPMPAQAPMRQRMR